MLSRLLVLAAVVGLVVCVPSMAYAADEGTYFDVVDDLNVKGTEGTVTDPDLEVSGVSRFDKAIHAGDLLASPYGGIGRYENLVERSEALDDAAWTKTGGVTASADAVAGPNGTTSAETLTDDVTAGGTVTQTEAVTLSADTAYTFSIWLKAGTGTTAKLKLEGNATGEVATETAALALTSTWQRFSVTDTITNNTAGGETLTATLNHTGGASTTLHAWGAQLEQAASAGVYAKTSTSAISGSRGLVSNTDLLIVGAQTLSGNQTISGNLQVTGAGPHYVQNGSLGIGTTGPDYLLHVSSSDKANAIGFSTSGITYVGTARPKRTIVLTGAGAIIPASNAPQQLQTNGTNVSFYTLNYSGTAVSAESAYWQFLVPDSYTGTTVNATLYWLTPSVTTTNAVKWFVDMNGVGDGQTLDAALNTAGTVIDNPTVTADQVLVTSEIAAITAGWTAGEYAVVRAQRNAADAADTETALAKLLMVKLEWTAGAESD